MYNVLNRLKLDSIIILNPNHYKGYLDRANFYFDIGEFQNAIDDYTKVIKLSEYPLAYYNRGLSYFNLGMKKKGCIDINESARLGYPVKKELADFCNN